MKKDSRELITFITQDGLYELSVLLMGLGNSPAVMQRLMDTVLRGMEKFARGYMDDIGIIFSNTFEHCEHLQKLLHKLREHMLTISPTKSKVAQSQLDDTGELRPVFFASRSLTPVERNYSATALKAFLRVGCRVD